MFRALHNEDALTKTVLGSPVYEAPELCLTLTSYALPMQLAHFFFYSSFLFLTTFYSIHIRVNLHE